MPFQVMAVEDKMASNYKSNQQTDQDIDSLLESEVDKLFNELNSVPIHSETSIAYLELIKSMKDDSLETEELQEVLKGYGINPFEYI